MPTPDAKTARDAIEKADAEWRRTQLAKGRPIDSYGRVMAKRAEADKPMRDFWNAVPEAAMRIALEDSGNERAMSLARRLTTGKRKGSLSRLCREEGISLQDLNDMWKKHNLAVGQALMASKMPDVMEDVATDALSTYVVCNRCDGTGLITRPVRAKDDEGGDILEQVEVTCPACKGAREVRQPGDKDARLLAFKTMGIIKEGAPTVAIQQNFGESFEDLMMGSQKLVQGVRVDDVEDV